MIALVPLSDFGNLIGLDSVIIFGSMIVLAVGIVSVVHFLFQRGMPGKLGGAPEQSLRQLESMRTSGLITEAEYHEQRKRILSQI